VMAAGILLACATMFLRILVVAAIMRPVLLLPLLAPVLLGVGVLLACAWHYWRMSQPGAGGSDASAGDEGSPVNPDSPAARCVQNSQPVPVAAGPAVRALLALVLLAAEALQHWFGQAGLYLLSVFTGLADVDSIVLSLSPKAGAELAMAVVITCICLAAATNTIVKGIYCTVIAGPGLGLRVLGPLLLAALVVVLAGLVATQV